MHFLRSVSGNLNFNSWFSKEMFLEETKEIADLGNNGTTDFDSANPVYSVN